jgi:hypothetical protein
MWGITLLIAAKRMKAVKTNPCSADFEFIFLVLMQK